jgi:hypothetical protein
MAAKNQPALALQLSKSIEITGIFDPVPACYGNATVVHKPCMFRVRSKELMTRTLAQQLGSSGVAIHAL